MHPQTPSLDFTMRENTQRDERSKPCQTEGLTPSE